METKDRYRIIVADDDPATLLMYKKTLGELYNVRTCTNGIDVLTEFAMHPADLIILDDDMPEMSGKETLESLRQSTLGWAVPVIVVSGKDTEEDIMQGLGLGANDYLIKPVKPALLLAKVKMMLQKKFTGFISFQGLAPGMIVSGHYRLESVIGEGGYSRVYRAEVIHPTGHQKMKEGDIVALKIFSIDGVGNREKQLSYFLREAYEHSRIHHPNVVELYDFGSMGQYYFLAMEYLEGETLAQRVGIDICLSAHELVKIAYAVGEALLCLSEQNLVHRDIKPSNIMLCKNGDIKILDFGLAKNPDEGTVSLEDVFRGTPHYTSPEQILNDPDIDIRSDLYSLAASLYAAATGEKPFDAISTMGILRRHLHDKMPPLRKYRPDLPVPFTKLIDQCLHRNKENRPTISQFLRVTRSLLEKS